MFVMLIIMLFMIFAVYLAGICILLLDHFIANNYRPVRTNGINIFNPDVY